MDSKLFTKYANEYIKPEADEKFKARMAIRNALRNGTLDEKVEMIREFEETFDADIRDWLDEIGMSDDEYLAFGFGWPY